MLILRMLLARKRDSTTQTPRPAIIVRAFRGGHANTAAVDAKCRNLSQLSHELTGRYETDRTVRDCGTFTGQPAGR